MLSGADDLPRIREALTLWVAAFDYQLLSYYMFNQITNLREVEIVTGLPVIGPEGDDVRQIARLFEQFRHLSAKNSCGSAVIRSSFLRKIELLYNRAAARRKEQYSLLDMPLGGAPASISPRTARRSSRRASVRRGGLVRRG